MRTDHSGYGFELKGGTSLSKGFDIIQRFPEDIDIRLEVDVGDTLPNMSRTISSWIFDRASETDITFADNRAIDVPCYHPGYTFTGSAFYKAKCLASLIGDKFRCCYDGIRWDSINLKVVQSKRVAVTPVSGSGRPVANCFIRYR